MTNSILQNSKIYDKLKKVKIKSKIMEQKISPLVTNIILENIINHKDPIMIYAILDSNNIYETEKLIFWNESMKELTGYSFEEVE